MRPITPALPDEYPAWPGVAVGAGDGSDVDHLAHDAAAFHGLALGGFADVGGSGAQDAERRDQVDIEHREVLFVGSFLDDVVPGIAGVVDDDVEAAECGERGIDELLRKVRSGDVAREVRGEAAGLLDGFLSFGGRVGIEIVDHDGSAGCGELLGDGAADAAARAGNEGCLVFERERHKEL